MSDPPVRADGLCARPGCEKPLQQITARHRRYGGDALLSEPFCSADCAREWHGCPREESVLASAVAKRTQACTECGTDLHLETPGCPKCRTRRYSRNSRNRQAA